ncbi:MerR family transcriptional regulator [Massilia sp. SM-13]|uniref:MerR family transcriptional regulator n=1 Tax=Pseudoduganella rhizocola TaxID=3382643 RepID=UPI0038B60DF1
MNTDVTHMPVPATISDVERDTGVAKETLRVWERRYDFPQPQRDSFGERVYPSEQVQKLRMIKRLIDLGYRPGKVISYDMEALQALAEKAADQRQPRRTPHPDLQIYLDLCKSLDADALRRRLSQALMVMGVRNFVLDLMAPLTTMVGDAWACGQFAVFEEHMVTESLQAVMHSAVFALPQASHISAAPRPRILLTTLPQERHGLGLLMAEALFSAEGAQCISLGVQTPLPDIVEAARSQQVDVVALSFSSAMNSRQVTESLKQLRARLPEHVELWIGGGNAALRRRPPGYLRIIELADISARLEEWRRLRAQLNAPAA